MRTKCLRGSRVGSEGAYTIKHNTLKPVCVTDMFFQVKCKQNTALKNDREGKKNLQHCYSFMKRNRGTVKRVLKVQMGIMKHCYRGILR